MKLGNTKLSLRQIFLGSLQFMNTERKKNYMEEEEDTTSNCNVSVENICLMLHSHLLY